MPIKNIEQKFEMIFDKQVNFFITARSYNQHRFSVHFNNGESAQGCLSTSQMKILGEFLIDTAEQIKSDPDYKSNEK